jgi:predicted ATPase
MRERSLSRVWDQLRGQSVQRKYFLEDVRIRGLRGIDNLRVPFAYPVTVLSGPNACGKSTLLQALACAYKVEGAGVKEYVPSTLFPRFLSRASDVPQDNESAPASLEYSYLHNAERIGMRWSRTGRGWNKTFGGRKGGQQPSRKLFMRTLANLSNPSEVRSYLQLGRQPLTTADVDASLLAFAHRILPFRYHELKVISHRSKELLFVRRVPQEATPDAAGAGYSEFHMSAGERSVLRLSRDLSRMENALVLIDEIETGLHPYTQQQLVYELQLLALRNQLQIVVTTHSPVIIESVPEEGRVFLERDRSTYRVEIKPPYRDVIQKAMYGVSRNKLSFLCEDEIAEALILGVFDQLNVELLLLPSDIVVGRDTSKTEYPSHLKALATFDLLPAFVFVLDGDGRDYEARLREDASELRQLAPQVVCLPGDRSPEAWIWARLVQHAGEYAQLFGVEEAFLRAELRRLEDIFEPASDKAVAKEKGRFDTLCADALGREGPEVARVVGRAEAKRGELFEVTQALEKAVRDWRSQRA